MFEGNSTDIFGGEQTKAINQLEGFASFKRTWMFERFIRLPNKIVALFTGNQCSKTASAAYQYVLRIMGLHPVAKRNVLYLECENRAKLMKITDDVTTYRQKLGEYLEVHKNKDSATWGPFDYPKDMKCPECGGAIILHKRKSRIFRFASETLPVEKENLGGDTSQSAEISNTQYPEFKKWLPGFLIKKDITHRRPAMVLLDPLSGMKFPGGITYPGSDVVVEFQSYKQTVQAGAGVQRMSVWVDEESPFDFFDEQLPRLLVEDGDLIMTVTPASGMTWTFDSIFEKARLYIRTQAIIDFYKREENIDYGPYTKTDSDQDIAVIQAATDDNPTLPIDEIEASYANTPDPDGTVIATRRYGIFKQATGRIFKDFQQSLHVIDLGKYGITNEAMREWVKGRSFDFHTVNPHAIVWVALSPTNEAFVYQEWNPSPGQWVTSRLCQELGLRSGFDKFICSLIDPLASTVNTNTGKTTLEEMNLIFHRLKLEGLCAGGYWESFATRGEVGRDAIKERLQNSVKCKTPFNNRTIVEGREVFLPTIWISSKCRNMADSLRFWRTEMWVSSKQLVTKDRKEKPTEKWSHFCTALEGLFKDKRFKPRNTHLTKLPEYVRFRGR